MTLLRDIGMYVAGIGSGVFLSGILAASDIGMTAACLGMLIFVGGWALYTVGNK